MQIQCPTCQATFDDISEDLIGQQVECECGASFEIPAFEAEENTAIEDADSKPCPKCGELIKIQAKKCKFCKAILDDSLAKKRLPKPSKKYPSPRPSRQRKQKKSMSVAQPADNYNEHIETGTADHGRISRRELPERLRELIHGKESILYASRPSVSALIISMVPAGVLLFGNLVFLLLTCFAEVPDKIPAIAFLGLGILFFTIILIFIYNSWKNTYYVITGGRTIASQGLFNIAIKIVLNKNIQLISINTGIIDRFLHLNSVEISTASQGGGIGGILAFFPGMAKGCVTLRHVVIKDVIQNYADL